MKHSLQTKLSFIIAMIALIIVALISFLSNYLISNKFKDYVAEQQELKAQDIAESLDLQHKNHNDQWDMASIHTIGMSALYAGYLIDVYDMDNNIIWDAQNHDMSLCIEIMDEITDRMNTRLPQMKGKFTSITYPLNHGDQKIGKVDITYYGPYFLSENDFKFLDALNFILVMIGIISLIFSLVIGRYLAKRLSNPILETVDATKKIADGNYQVRIEDGTDIKEMEMLTLSVNHLAESLYLQENLRKQLTQDVAHELRTPIAVLQTHLEALVDGMWEPTNERLSSCYEEVTRIGTIVRDLENLAKVDSDNLQLMKQEIFLNDIIEFTIRNFETEIKNRNLTVTHQGSCSSVQADRDRISQVIVNLLSNAIKYTPPGGNISLELSENKNYVILRVKDTGIGVAEEELPFIFERFYRADKSRNRNTGGAGIGLAIVKAIMDAHHGKVIVESKVDQGSCFEITLPK
ncbi:MAG: integral rane sensor signal transduction histidine kinase [Herbinix sp.]|jgi:signal transduction histidine kinase|nr:integral rane sensor signal transduction histidine kinase [Herbinix sp.]